MRPATNLDRFWGKFGEARCNPDKLRGLLSGQKVPFQDQARPGGPHPRSHDYNVTARDFIGECYLNTFNLPVTPTNGHFGDVPNTLATLNFRGSGTAAVTCRIFCAWPKCRIKISAGVTGPAELIVKVITKVLALDRFR